MIESWYWQQELAKDIRWLKTHQRVKRWSEKQVVMYERRLMLVAFQVRALLERPKVNSTTRSLSLSVKKYPKIGEKPFTAVGGGHVEDRFDLKSPQPVRLSVLDVCNQLIHYYWMTTAAEHGRFTTILIFSDYKRHECAFEFDIGNLIALFTPFSTDCSSLYRATFTWSEKRQDYLAKDS